MFYISFRLYNDAALLTISI